MEVSDFYSWQQNVIDRLYRLSRPVKVWGKKYYATCTYNSSPNLCNHELDAITYQKTMKYYKLVKRIEKKLVRLEKQKQEEEARMIREKAKVEKLFRKNMCKIDVGE
jgi:hypothetical protein